VPDNCMVLWEEGGEARHVMSDGNTPGVLTASQPFSVAPAAADNIRILEAYWPDENRDAAGGSGTGKGGIAWLGVNGLQVRLNGVAAEKLSMSFGGDDAGKLSASVAASEGEVVGGTTLKEAGGILAGDLAFDVGDDSIVPGDVSTTRTVSLTIFDPTDPANTLEHIKVRAVDGANRFTDVVRAQHGSGAVAHALDEVIVPYTPDRVFAGMPIPSIDGVIVIGSSEQAVDSPIKVEGGSLDVETPLLWEEDVHGTEWKRDRYAFGKRGYSFSMRGILEVDPNNDRTGLLGELFRDPAGSPRAVLVQQGDEGGSIHGFFLRKVFFESPDIDFSSELVSLALKGKGKAPTPTPGIGTPAGGPGYGEGCIYFG